MPYRDEKPEPQLLLNTDTTDVEGSAPDRDGAGREEQSSVEGRMRRSPAAGCVLNASSGPMAGTLRWR